MKKILIIIFAAVFVLSGCDSNQQNLPKGKSVSVKGRVTQIERGKDGYTAKIKTDDNKLYSAVISSVNMAGSGQYKEVKIGDVINVEGEEVSSDGSIISVTVLR